MSSQLLFKEFVVLFRSWPVDSTKSGRCVAEYIRKMFNQSFKQGELSTVDTNYWSQVLNDLRPIADNVYAAKYPRQRAVGSLGLGKEQCKLAVSNTALKFYDDEFGKKNE